MDFMDHICNYLIFFYSFYFSVERQSTNGRRILTTLAWMLWNQSSLEKVIEKRHKGKKICETNIGQTLIYKYANRNFIKVIPQK